MLLHGPLHVNKADGKQAFANSPKTAKEVALSLEADTRRGRSDVHRNFWRNLKGTPCKRRYVGELFSFFHPLGTFQKKRDKVKMSNGAKESSQSPF